MENVHCGSDSQYIDNFNVNGLDIMMLCWTEISIELKWQTDTMNNRNRKNEYCSINKHTDRERYKQ